MKYTPREPDEHGVRRCTCGCEYYNAMPAGERCNLYDCFCSVCSPCEMWAREIAGRLEAREIEPECKGVYLSFLGAEDEMP